MQPSMANEVSEALPVLVCASNFGWVNRPRLWWTLVDWSSNLNDSKDDGPLQWTREGKWQRLRLPAHCTQVGLRLPIGRPLLLGWGGVWTPVHANDYHPCMDDNGRPAPKSARGRLLPTPRHDGSRTRVAHRKEAMTQDDTGRLLIPPPKIKEQLHDIPADYTAVDGPDDRTRHRLLALIGGWPPDCSPS